MAKTQVTVDTKKLVALLSIGGPKVMKTVSQALYKEGAAIFEESQDEVPVDTNALRTSGQLGFPKIEGKNVVIEISYGGAAVDYALIVHEDLEAQRRHGKKAKYLEDPTRRRLKGMDKRILDSVKRAMGI